MDTDIYIMLQCAGSRLTSSQCHPVKRRADDDTHDLICALQNCVHPQVPHVPLNLKSTQKQHAQI